jgi:hypothetical protein
MIPGERDPIEHELKVWPEFFDALESGRKTFELREFDRDFREGDTLRLREYDPKNDDTQPPGGICIGRIRDGYSGREVRRLVTYVFGGAKPTRRSFETKVAPGWCILGLAVIDPPVAPAAGNPGEWYTYDPEDGYERFKTEAEAEAHAEAVLSGYRDESSEGWHDAVGDIEYGRLIPVKYAMQVDRHDTPEGDFDFVCNYVLAPVLP